MIILDILILTNAPPSIELGLIKNEVNNRGLSTITRSTDEISSENVEEYNPQLVYVPSSLFGRATNYEMIHRFLLLEKLGENIPVVNPLMSLLRYSKAYISEIARDMGIPHPDTLVTENIVEAHDFIQKLFSEGSDAILKPMARAQGSGVQRLTASENGEFLMQKLHQYSKRHGLGVFYIQRYIQNRGYDIRLFIVNNEVVARMKRSNPHDFRYNASRGGVVEPYKDKMYDEIALKIAGGMDLKITGVDILPSYNDKPFLLEANCYPGFIHINQASGIKIQTKIVDYIYRTIKK